jgi:hypothetical protein
MRSLSLALFDEKTVQGEGNENYSHKQNRDGRSQSNVR